MSNKSRDGLFSGRETTLKLFVEVEVGGIRRKTDCHVNKSQHSESNSIGVHLRILLVAPEFRNHVVSHGEQENQCCHEEDRELKCKSYIFELTIPLVCNIDILVGRLGMICQSKRMRQLVNLKVQSVHSFLLIIQIK